MKRRMKKLALLLALVVAVNTTAESVVSAASATETAEAAIEEQALVDESDPAIDEVSEPEEDLNDEIIDTPEEVSPDTPDEGQEEIPEAPEEETSEEETSEEESDLTEEPEENLPEEEEEILEEEEIIEEDEVIEEEEEILEEEDSAWSANDDGDVFWYVNPEEKWKLEFELCNADAKKVDAELVKVDASTEKNHVVIPESFTFEGVTYKVASFVGKDYSAMNVETFTFPENFREITGNLFDFEKTFYTSLNDIGLTTGVSAYISVPNTEGVLSSMPSYISGHYVDGAYYAGKCLVRVDPAYTGDFTVKEGTICILAGAMEGCTGLQKVTIPKSVEFIGMRAFANSSVTEVNLPASLKGAASIFVLNLDKSVDAEIASLTFYGCSSLERVVVEKKSLSGIGYEAFLGCSSLKGFDFTKVGAIDGFAFAGAFNPDAEVVVDLKNTVLTSSIAHFSNSGIKAISFGNKNTTAYTEICYNTPSLKKITWGAVKTVNCRAFEGCTGLTYDIFAGASAFNKLDYRAFANIGAKELTVSVMTNKDGDRVIQGGVFADNPQLETLNWSAETPGTESLFAILNDMNDESKGYASTTSTTYLSKSNPTGMPNNAQSTTQIKTLNILKAPTKSNFFQQLPYLKTVNYKCAVSTIPMYTFQYDYSLEKVTFKYPTSLKTIGGSAFLNCVSLRTFPFASLTNLTKIENSAFKICNVDTGSGIYANLTVNVLEGLASSDPFGTGNWGLKEINLSKNTKLKTIESAAFFQQINAKKLYTPASLTSVGSNSFVFSRLEEVTIAGPFSGSNWAYAGHPLSIFYNTRTDSNHQIEGNTTLKKLTIKKAEKLSCIDFAHFLALEEVSISGTATGYISFDFDSNLKTVKLPNGPTTVGQSNGGFFKCTSLKSITLPKTVQYIGTGAFINLTNLQTVNLPANLKAFGSGVFMGCSSLKSITIPSGVSFIGNGLFLGCDSLESVTISGETYVGNGAFYRLPKLKTVNMPKVNSIGSAAFYNCPKLTKVTMPNVKYIDEGAFFNDIALKNVSLPKVETINNAAFLGCVSLTKISLPKAININAGAFYNCTSLASVSLNKKTLKNVRYGAFGNTGIKTATMYKDVTYETGVYAHCTKLETVTIENGTGSIPDFMFAGDTAIKKISIPYGVSVIGWGAFKYAIKPTANLKITLPQSVSKIEDDAFAGSGVKELVVENPEMDIELYHSTYAYNPLDSDLLPIPETIKVTTTINNESVLEYKTYVSERYGKEITVDNSKGYSIYYWGDYSTQPNTTRVYSPSATMKTITLKAASKPGYHFDGWFKSVYNAETDDYEYVKVTKITKADLGDMYLTAHFTPNTYKVVFDKNTKKLASYSMPSKTVAYNETVRFADIMPSYVFKDGYKNLQFAGWNTKANGTGIMITEGGAFSELTTKNGATVTLYAQWVSVPVMEVE